MTDIPGFAKFKVSDLAPIVVNAIVTEARIRKENKRRREAALVTRLAKLRWWHSDYWLDGVRPGMTVAEVYKRIHERYTWDFDHHFDVVTRREYTIAGRWADYLLNMDASTEILVPIDDAAYLHNAASESTEAPPNSTQPTTP